MAAAPLSRLTLVLGGARSGKSRLCRRSGRTVLPPPWTYLATAEAFDDEMRARIDRAPRAARRRWRRSRRRSSWPRRISAHRRLPRPLLIDCLTLWLSNIMLAGADLTAASDRLIDALAAAKGPLVAVSNEVGLGIVPDTTLGRRVPRRARLAQSARRRGRRPCRILGRGAAADAQVELPRRQPIMAETPADAERHKAKMANRKAAQDAEVAGEDDREGPAHRPHRQGQGQVDGGVRPAAARARARLPRRRRAVRQGRLGYRRAPRHRALSRSGGLARAGRRLHLGNAGPRARRRRRRARLGQGGRAHGRPRDPPAHPR